MLAAGSLASLTAAPTVRRLICCCWALPLAILRVTPGGRQLDVCVELLGSPWHPWTAGGAPRARALGTARRGGGGPTGPSGDNSSGRRRKRALVPARRRIFLPTIDFALRAVWLPSPQPCPSTWSASLSCSLAWGIRPRCDARTATSAAAHQRRAPPDEVLRPEPHPAAASAPPQSAPPHRSHPRSRREARASPLPNINTHARVCRARPCRPPLRARGRRWARRAAGVRGRAGRRTGGARPAAPTA